MHHKPFGGWSLSGTAGGTYISSTDPLAGLSMWGPWEGEGRIERKLEEKRGREGKGKIVKRGNKG